MTIFLTTQYLEEADRLADRVAVLSGGRIVAQGTPAELKARVGGEVVVLEFADAGTAARAARPGGRDRSTVRLATTVRIHVLEVPTDGSGAELRTLLDTLARGDAEPSRVTIRRPSLDDVFLALTDRANQPADHSTQEALR